MPCNGQTVRSLAQRVSNLLGDQCPGQQYNRWTLGTLIDIINDARCSLVSLRPDAFADVVDLPLVPGSEQTLPKPYEQLIEVLTSGEGDTKATVGQGDAYYTKALRGKKCLAGDCHGTDAPYVMAYAATNEKHPKVYTVSPPVPPGQNPTVRAIVVRTPAPYCPADESKELDVECSFVPALTEFALYKAYGMEIDSAASEQASERHFKNYLALIDKAYLYAQRWGSGYYKGEVGSKDPTFKGR